LDGELRLGDVGLHTLRFGTYGYARSKSDTVYHSNNPTLSQGTGPIECLYCGYHTDIRDDLLMPFDAGNFFSDLRANIPRQWQTFDYVSYLTWLQSQEAQANYAMANPMRPPNYWNQVIMENGGFDVLKQPASSTVRERVLGAYAQLDFGGDLSDMPWSGNLGLRYVYTTQRSEGERRNLEELVYADATLFQAIYGPSTPMSVPKSYGNILPSLNLRLDPIDGELVLRAGYSRSLTRPTLSQLRPQILYDTNRPGNLKASQGSPTLKPFNADNFDLSAEWYYDQASYLAVAGFYKRVGNFIVETVGQMPATKADGVTPVMLPPPYMSPPGTPSPGPAVYDLRQPVNQESANIYGLEVSWQHTFTSLPTPFDGMGVLANVTFSDSNARVAQDDNVTRTFALEGLSNTQNLVAFYEKGPVQVRAALNNRTGFLETISGIGGEPVFVKGYTQLDLSGSFDITEQFQGFFQAINVTDARIEKHGRFENHFLELKDTGARYALGLRGTF
ncbi:MAG: TonB-dependent receptor, partial [Proteobacteria bacterium]|nr:TonB-dependent receptor [Pseudomonadota bacterium]